MAIATHTHPDQWWETDDDVLVTVLDVLDERAKAIQDATR